MLLKRIIIFIVLNFGALSLGSYLMNNGPRSEWYAALDKAPWNPPGWLFGVAWFSIMACFALYLSWAYPKVNRKLFLLLFIPQWILNVSWNYVFFNQQLINGGIIVLLLLTAIVYVTLFAFYKPLKMKSLLIVPYCLWLVLACSLNIYIAVYN
ncbi:MAG: TspO/MBR family protein [Flavobacteriaceae bacterium]